MSPLYVLGFGVIFGIVGRVDGGLIVEAKMYGVSTFLVPKLSNKSVEVDGLLTGLGSRHYLGFAR